MSGELVPNPSPELIVASKVSNMMSEIRPQWQAKGLIERRLLPVDPSSACQRLLNAAVQDLKEKVIIAGVDIASEAASTHKLPPISKAEDVENYSTARLLDLCYRMGLLTRPEWRKMTRSYDIRRDLEHEDSEYEAGIEDCIYIFTSCIGSVLSRDPITLIKVSEVKQIIEATSPATAGFELLEDYGRAPDTRQEEIQKFLVAKARDAREPDLVRQNAYVLLQELKPLTRDSVRVAVAKYLQDKLKREPLQELDVRVAQSSGILPYLRKAQRTEFFRDQLNSLVAIGHGWRSHASHGLALRNLSEFGGLSSITDPVRSKMIKWLTLCYIGEPGGYGAGRNRRVFFSNSAAPLIEQIFEDAGTSVTDELKALQDDKDIKRMSKDENIARRYQDLLDLVDL